MSTDRRMDKEDVVHICNGILLSHKRNKGRSFVETWMSLNPRLKAFSLFCLPFLYLLVLFLLSHFLPTPLLCGFLRAPVISRKLCAAGDPIYPILSRRELDFEWILMEKFLDQMWRDRKERDDRHIFYKTESRKK